MYSEQEHLARLKAQYQETPLPPMLEERIRDTMKQKTFEEKSRPAKPSGALRTLYRGLGAAAAALGVITLLANASPATAKAMSGVPVLGPIAKLLTFRTYEDSRFGIEARIEIPQLDALESPARENLQSAVDAYAQSLIALHEESVDLTEQAAAKDPDLIASSLTAHQSLDTYCDVVAETDNMFCLRMATDLVMASGSESRRHFVLDKRTGALLSLSDLFAGESGYAATLVAEVQSQMAQNSAMDDSLAYFPEDVSIGADQDFYITKDGGLVLCFDEYAVAPGYMGALEFPIATQSIAGLLNTDLVHGG